MMSQRFFLLSCLCLIFLNVQSQTNTIQVTDLLKIQQVNNITSTRDGSRAAFTLTSITPDPINRSDYKYQTQIYILDITNGNRIRKMTAAKESSSQPAFSPNGKQLAFVRQVDNRSQIFVLPMDGGEAWQLTKANYNASSPKWSPDGKQILYSISTNVRDLIRDTILNPARVLPTWWDEKPGFNNNDHLRISTVKANPDGSMDEIRAYLEQNVIDRKATVLNKLNFQDEANISAGQAMSHFFIINAQPEARPVPITKGFTRFSSVDFTPDGKSLIITASLDSTVHPDRSLESAIYTSSPDGSQLKLLLGEKGKSFSNPTLSHNAKWLSYQVAAPMNVGVAELYVVPFNGNSSASRLIDLDRSKGSVAWSADDRILFFTAQSNGGAPLYKADMSSGKVDRLTDFNSGVLSFDIAGDKVVYATTAVDDPSSLLISDLGGKQSQKLSSFNGWVQGKKLSLPEKKTFVNEKGMTIEYWVMKPYNFQPGKKYPLLLEIHGGPSAMWGPGEASMWHEFQYFCSKGYGVVYANPRGSGGYGTEFLRGNIRDWGAGPTSDVLSALDRTVTEGWADTSKLLVSGGSYAGYLVAWIVSHDNRFAAACSQRGVYDLATFFGEGNAWRLVPNYFGGYPWQEEVQTVLRRESPIYYVNNITTPYLIFHGDNDRRTGFVQSEMMYRSLKALNRPVEYVRHPEGTHELTRSGDNRQRIDQMLRTYEFFQRWLDKK